MSDKTVILITAIGLCTILIMSTVPRIPAVFIGIVSGATIVGIQIVSDIKEDKQ